MLSTVINKSRYTYQLQDQTVIHKTLLKHTYLWSLGVHYEEVQKKKLTLIQLKPLKFIISANK